MTATIPQTVTRHVDDEHERNTELLRTELPNYRLADSAYLRWLYDENPLGHAIRRQADDEQRRPHRALRDDPAALPGPGGHGSGGVLAARGRPHGHAAARAVPHRSAKRSSTPPRPRAGSSPAGVCNEKSIGTVVKYLDWKTPGPLPVRICLPMSLGRHVESYAVDDAFRAGALRDLAAGLDSFSVRDWTNSYTPEYLAWRLALPARVVRGARHRRARRVTTTDTPLRGPRRR